MSGRRVCSVLFLALISIITLAQDRTPRQSQETEAAREKNEQQERQQWFRDGRTAAVGSKTLPAELLHRAHQQSLLRNFQRQLSVANGATLAATAVVNPLWQPLGPGPMISSDDPSNFQDYGNVSGRVTAVVVDQSDPTGNTVYVAGAYSGVWKSTNAAGPAASVTWTPLTDDQATLSVGALSLSPDGNTLLVGTGEPDNAGDSYYGLGILRGTNMKTLPTWTLISSSDLETFRGQGFSKFARSSANPNLVVAALSQTSKNLGSGPANPGLFFSLDGGLSWRRTSVFDGATRIGQQSTTSVVYNAATNTFFAAMRFHGYYSSTDGINWTRLANQPGGAALSVTACTANATLNCPIGRAEMAVTPGRNEIFTWFVDLTVTNRSVFVSRDNGVTWSDLGTGGQMANCGDILGGSPAGCDSDQGSYNLELTSLPTPTGTDIYAGAINIFKCSLPSGATTACNWLNTTHVYGCSPLSSLAHVHPDQHGIDFLQANPSIVYFGNDGGVYRTLNQAGINSGACTAHNPYDNLNTNLALTQFVWFSHDPTADQVLLGGTQDNGSPSLNPAVASVANPQLWTNYLGGDGGYTAIDPVNTSNWFMSQPFTDIFGSAVGVNARGTIIGPVITAAGNLAGDDGAFYTPFMLDPGATSRMVVGTCRVWRGNTNGTAFSPVSNNFSTGDASVCNSVNHTTIRALAAGGPVTANGSQVIYAGTSAAARPGKGRVFVTENADAGPGSWTDRTSAINQQNFQISAIVIDPNDPTGRTAFATIMGFGVSHVFRTGDAGLNWSDVTGDLPDAPADSFAIDPNDPNTWYLATDTGVYVTTNGGVNWTEYGPATGAGTLPNVAPTHLETINTATTKKLRVSTYGRGIWQTDLRSALAPPAADFVIAGVSLAQPVLINQAGTIKGFISSIGGFSSSVTISCIAGPGTPPPVCNGQTVAVTPGVPAPFTIDVGTNNGIQTFSFQIKATGADAAATTHTQNVAVNVGDFTPFFPQGTASTPAGGRAFVAGEVLATNLNVPVTLTCTVTAPATGVSCSVPGTVLTQAIFNLIVNVDPTVPPGTVAVVTYTATYNGVTQNSLTAAQVSVTDFTLGPTGSAVATVSKGGSATYTIGATGSGFTGAISLACTDGLPSGAACSFNPATINTGSTSTLTITTRAGSIPQVARIERVERTPWYAIALFLPGMVVIGFAARRRKYMPLLLLLIATSVLVLMPACGGGGGNSVAPPPPPPPVPGTPSGTYAITITATSGSVSHVTSVTLVVQ